MSTAAQTVHLQLDEIQHLTDALLQALQGDDVFPIAQLLLQRGQAIEALEQMALDGFSSEDRQAFLQKLNRINEQEETLEARLAQKGKQLGIALQQVNRHRKNIGLYKSAEHSKSEPTRSDRA